MTAAGGRGGARVLVVWPPHVPSYFNAGHRTPMFMVAGYLRRLSSVAHVRTVDAGALNATWKDVGDVLYQGDWDVVAIVNEFDALEGMGRFVRYARELCPRAALVTFGRLSGMVPGFFERYDLDGIVHSGDFEAGVAAFVAWWLGDRRDALAGVHVRHDGGWRAPTGPGPFLEPDDWVLPDVGEIPYQAYERLYARDENKFCGIPQRWELVVPAARGCPVQCAYCEVPELFGARERRLSVDAVVEYVEESFARLPFEYVAFYSPTFTLKRAWMEELCTRLVERGSPYPWKCATTVHHLGKDLVKLMGAAGCIRISVGLETLDEAGFSALPRLKQVDDARFDRLAEWCDEAGIELNCFIIVGLPGTTLTGTHRTFEAARSLGARVRPTVYSPIHEMRADMDETEIGRFNRQLFVGERPADHHALYGYMFGPEPCPTVVMDRVPVRRERQEEQAEVGA